MKESKIKVHKNTSIPFKLVSDFKPAGDQPKAIDKLVERIEKDKNKWHVLLGATGTGKTYTMANVIARTNKRALILAPNKTLCGQLFQEFKSFFPENRVEYFVSQFDMYQPEAYNVNKAIYIDSSSVTNAELRVMRLSTMQSLATRHDTIVIASVAAIFGTYNPNEYYETVVKVNVGMEITIRNLVHKLVKIGYQRNDQSVVPGKFQVKGQAITLAFGYEMKNYLLIEIEDDKIFSLTIVDDLNRNVIKKVKKVEIGPGQDYIMDHDILKRCAHLVKEELKERVKYFDKVGKPLLGERLKQRTELDMEELLDKGICKGIENYSRHLDGRDAGVSPYTILDYFDDDYITICDESHLMLPQIKGMYNANISRKKNLVDYGFRLPSALDNRPIDFEEFKSSTKQIFCISATPSSEEIGYTEDPIIEQIVRPTGLLDPIIDVKSTKGQIEDIKDEIRKVVKKNQRAFITVLTIRMAEALATNLLVDGFKVAYLHNELKTLDRNEILLDLRRGIYDVVVGINLIREGIDTPEVSLVAILDADKPGFLRDERSLIQTIGRAARNADGRVILYGDKITDGMKGAIYETRRRREKQEKHNIDNNIIPKTIIKPIKSTIEGDTIKEFINKKRTKTKLLKKGKKIVIEELTKQMKKAARDYDFDRAIAIQAYIAELQSGY